MGLLDFFFRTKNVLPFSKVITFDRIESDFYLDVGDQVSLWNKPNTTKINLYAKTSADGQGLVGVAYNTAISSQLGKTKFLIVENKIVGLSVTRIKLLVRMYVDEETVIRREQEQKLDWIAKIQKRYNPKKSWEIRFISEQELHQENLQIKTISKSQVSDFYTNQDDAIWLSDNYGMKLNTENRVLQSATEKTLRAVFSNHILSIKKVRKEHDWYHITVDVNNDS